MVAVGIVSGSRLRVRMLTSCWTIAASLADWQPRRGSVVGIDLLELIGKVAKCVGELRDGLALPIRNVLREEKPDVVHTHNLQGLPVGVFDLLRSHKGPVVHTIHDYYFLCPRLCLLHRNGFLCDRKKRVEGHLESRPEKHICKWYRIFLRKKINGVYTKVIAPSKFILDIHAEFGFCNRTNSEVIPLGSTFGDTLPIARERNKPVSFLFIGTLSAHKGVRILLEAIRKLRDWDAEFHIAGTGDLEEECRDAARKDGRIRFHGFVRGAQKEDLFARCDFLILPSIWYDNSPVVIYEAFSWGMPVIASSIGGIPELVRDGENGFLFEPGSITDLAHRIESCLRSPDAVDFLRVNALRRSAELSFETHINRQLEVYKTLAGGYGV